VFYQPERKSKSSRDTKFELIYQHKKQMPPGNNATVVNLVGKKSGPFVEKKLTSRK